MSVRWLDEPAQRAFADAVLEVERASAAEVVIAVRRSARRWPHVPLVVGIVAAWAALGFMLYVDHAFSLPSILVDPFVFGALVGAASLLAPPLVRLLTPASIRRRAVVEAARAQFQASGIHRTRGRTGVLVYCALTERMAAVVADDGVLTTIDVTRWHKAELAIDAAIGRGGVATADAVRALGPLLAPGLPRGADDRNELPDAIDHDLGAAILAAARREAP